MRTVRINGKDMPSDTALELLKKESVRVKSASFSLDPPAKKPKRIEPNSEGFAIPKALISEMCRTMDRMNADRIKYSLRGSPYILKRDLIITMETQRPEPTGLKKLARRLGEWFMEKSE